METEVDYVKAKKKFMSLVNYWLNNQPTQYKQMYKLHFQQNIEAKIFEISSSRRVTDRSRKYSVIERRGKKMLILRKEYNFDPDVQVLSWEEIFDIFMPKHVESGHKGREVLMNMAGVNYKFPSMCLTFFKRVCNICTPGSERVRESLTPSSTGLVYVISMVMMRTNEHFRYLLIYVDEKTNFVFLRPLMVKTEHEIALELFKIFTTFGAPKILRLHGYNSHLTKLVDKKLKEMCPMFKIETEHNHVSYDMPTIVTDKINEWMRKNNCDIWEVGAYIVQRQMNNDPKMLPSNEDVQKDKFATPHSLFFHTPSSRRNLTEESTKESPEPDAMMSETVTEFEEPLA